MRENTKGQHLVASSGQLDVHLPAPIYSAKSVMPALKRTRLTASAWRKANWCINCVLMRVMERRERDSFTAFHYPHQHTVDTPVYSAKS